MNQNRNDQHYNEEVTIDLGELLRVFLGKIHIILLVGILCALIAFIGTKLLITPEYDSTSKIYILTRSNTETLTSSDLSVSSYLTKDYAELVVSRPVLENVIAVLNLDLTTKQLKENITVSSSSDTRIIAITASNPEPQLAKDIVDAIRETASIQIQSVMDVDAVNTVEDGNLPVNPARPNTAKNTAIGLILGMILAMIIIAIVHISDDTVKTAEDVEKYLGLNVLASISEKDSLAHGSKKKTKTQKAKIRR